jgi:hypothetical protein
MNPAHIVRYRRFCFFMFSCATQQGTKIEPQAQRGLMTSSALPHYLDSGSENFGGVLRDFDFAPDFPNPPVRTDEKGDAPHPHIIAAKKTLFFCHNEGVILPQTRRPRQPFDFARGLGKSISH